MVLVNIMNVQRNPVYWGNDAESFIPERFALDKMKEVHPYAYLPFTGEKFHNCRVLSLNAFVLLKLGGPRLCLAYKYGMLSIKLFLAHIIRSFEVSSNLKYADIELDIPIILKIKQGYNMSIRKRKGHEI